MIEAGPAVFDTFMAMGLPWQLRDQVKRIEQGRLVAMSAMVMLGLCSEAYYFNEHTVIGWGVGASEGLGMRKAMMNVL